MYHMHHIIPKHMGGSDDPSNLIKLTVAQHAEAHRQLYERYGHWEDKCAWLALTKQIDTDQIRRMKASEANKGKRSGRRLEATLENGKIGNEVWRGQKHSDAAKLAISEKNKEYWGNQKERPWQYRTHYIVDGVEYTGFKEITEHFSVSRQTVYNRCKSDKFPNWKQIHK